ncbi:MAG: non-homologous end-joining DNA ligase [Methanomicrobiales archaeon]|nr:non-homologous end-joining DNA ligase [Methanomicrobiales archaeon]
MVNPLLESLPPGERDRLGASLQPDWVEPMLATLSRGRSFGQGWIFERKLDGERCLVFRRGDKVRLLSRTRHLLNDTYPELEEALLAQPSRDFVADGEIVAFIGGNTSFSRLQARLGIYDREEARRIGVPVFLCLFDLLYLDGYDLTRLLLRTRKAILAKALSYRDPLRFNPHTDGGWEAFYGNACRNGWEGVVAKRASGPYVHGRSTDWLKLKCVNRQEFIIGGYTEPQGGRTGFGALLLGYHEDEVLLYAGKVGTGFDEQMLLDLAGELARRETGTSPFADRRTRERGEHWVTPDLVCEVAFAEWTPDHRLRQPRFVGMRRDKAAADVVREVPG